MSGGNALNTEKFNLLQQADWGEIYKMLVLHAIKRAHFYGWCNSDSEMLAGRDFTVDDIVQHVMEKILKGERNWDPEKVPLNPWLRKQVDSVMDAWIKRESGKYEVPFGDDNGEDMPSGKNNDLAPKLDNFPDGSSPQPEAIIFQKEIAVENSKQLDRVLQAISGDKELEELYDAITETGETKPSVLAKYLNTDISEINNRKKRFFRRLEKL